MYDDLLATVQRTPAAPMGKTILVSVNPDLKSDFGHFLNYEKRINEICHHAGITHHCLSNREFKTNLPYISGIFTEDSGHFCLLRKAAQGNERALTANLHQVLVDWIAANNLTRRYETVILFIYMSSSRSAAQLSCFDWPANVHVVANAFWDFLAPPPRTGDPDLARIKLQDRVRLCAMSISHQKQLQDLVGFDFPAIPNPPPLVSDSQFFQIMRTSIAEKTTRPNTRTHVFLPGLMTLGKGREITEDYIKAASQRFSGCSFTVRDRKGELAQTLGAQLPQNVRLAPGDFSDAEIIEFYRTADITLLPYSSAVFQVRTSGALVDCLMSGTIPIVFAGTWLADICQKYDFGLICAGETVEDMLEATLQAERNRTRELQRMLPAAVAYMRDNGWACFQKTVCGFDAPAAPPVQPAPPRQADSFPVPAHEKTDMTLLRLVNRMLLGDKLNVEKDLTLFKTLLDSLPPSSDRRQHFSNVMAHYGMTEKSKP